MKQDIKLYIENNLVDFSDEISIPFTYELEDTSDPAAVKNNFTKNITIPGTKNNNRIFGEIYNVDRNLLYDSSNVLNVYFDPSKRTPFTLYKNNDIVESGYMQLNSISIKNKVVNYEITLYGGIGDFFYNLAYTEEGDEKSLKDLVYGITDESGNTLPAASEMDFVLDKDFVNNCWLNINNGTDTLYNTISFVPSYNGIYDNFSNDKVLINTKNSQVFTTTATTVDNINYTTVNGYALGELNNEYNEWEIRDLRSYMQRPALKFDKFIKAICNTENNGGYQVKLDETFFNDENPYYSKSYILLPTFATSYPKTENQSESTGIIKFQNFTYEVGNTLQQPTYYFNVTNTDNIISNDNTYIIDYSALPLSNKLNLELNFSLKFNAKDTSQVLNKSVLYTQFNLYKGVASYQYWNPAIFYFRLVDEYNNIIANKTYTFYGTLHTEPNTSTNTFYQGYFKNDGNNNFYYYTLGNNNTFNVNFENIYVPNNKFKIQAECYFYYNIGVADSTEKYYESYTPILGDIEILLDNSNILIKYDDQIGSGARITKDKLLTTDETPLNFLLSYTKLFNLNYLYNPSDKSISILTKNNYFKNQIINIEDIIDYNQDINITPLLFNSKFLRLKYETDTENYYLGKYNTDYNISYGQKRLKTGYNFNNDTKDLLDDNLYENVVQVLDNSKYYRNFFSNSNVNCPPFLTDNLVYKLYNGDNITDINIYGSNLINLSKTVEFSNLGYDIFDKPAFYNLDNNIKKLSDISSSLIFYQNKVELKDINNNLVPYFLTDDVTEMYKLNESPCYLYTESTTNVNGDSIAIKLTALPKFTRYITTNSNINYSFDIEKPNEIYIPNINYPDGISIYNKYWENYLKDQFDVNTKKIECYVNLQKFDSINNLNLQPFYYFKNSYWILNKINEYDINSHKTTKCEFIKVGDINNYLNGQTIGRYNIYAEQTDYSINYQSQTISITFHNNIPIKLNCYQSGVTIDNPNLQAGINIVQVTLPENTKFDNIFYYLYVDTLDNSGFMYSISIDQLPNPDITIKVSGYAKYEDGSLIPSCRIVVNNDNFTNVMYANEETGYFSIYAAKNQDFNFEIQTSYSTAIYSTTISASSVDINRNFILPKN